MTSADPERRQEYTKPSLSRSNGAQVPRVTASSWPTVLMPVITGVEAVVKASAVITAVGALARVTVACRSLEPVTSTVIRLPTSSAART